MKAEFHDPRCKEGESYVHPYVDAYGRRVKGHCRKNKPTRVRPKKVEKMKNSKWFEVFSNGDVWELNEKDGKLYRKRDGTEVPAYCKKRRR